MSCQHEGEIDSDEDHACKTTGHRKAFIFRVRRQDNGEAIRKVVHLLCKLSFCVAGDGNVKHIFTVRLCQIHSCNTFRTVARPGKRDKHQRFGCLNVACKMGDKRCGRDRTCREVCTLILTEKVLCDLRDEDGCARARQYYIYFLILWYSFIEIMETFI